MQFNLEDLKFQPDHENWLNFGSLQGCKQCSGYLCCGIIKEGGKIEPPFLTNFEIENIKYFTGLKKGQFAVKKENPFTGNIIHFMRTTLENGCIFFNKQTGKCSIYNMRPFDCRLFPLDIIFKKNMYYWSLFKFKMCREVKEYLSNNVVVADRVLPYTKQEIHEYATCPVPGMDDIGYEIIREINLSRQV